jgi:hypothetical protein
MRSAAFIAILAGIIWYLQSRAGAASPARMSAREIKNISQDIVARHNLNASPCMLAAMAFVESGDINDIPAGVNVLATRVEPHINDVSAGIMQVLFKTAFWLYDDMGYDAYNLASPVDLYDPEKSIYFAACYIDWLSNYRGSGRDERWIVQSYNGGPGADSGQVRNHYSKYMQAKRNLELMGVC